MKKKSTSRSAFFNLRVLIGLCIVLVGVVLVLLASGVLSSATAQSIIQAMTKGKIITSSSDPLVRVGVDCSTIHEKGIDKQENFRAAAIMIACGEVSGATTSATSTLGPTSHFIKKLLMPLPYGATAKNPVTGTEPILNTSQPATTLVLPSSGTCIFLGTTLIFPTRTSSLCAPLTAVRLGAAQST